MNEITSIPARRAKPLTPPGCRIAVEDGAVAYGLLLHDMMTEAGFDEATFSAIRDGIRARVQRLKSGDTDGLLTDLVSQSAWLLEMAAYCAQRGMACESRPSAADVWLRLALKYATQHSRTVGILAAVAAGKARAISD